MARMVLFWFYSIFHTPQTEQQLQDNDQYFCYAENVEKHSHTHHIKRGFGRSNEFGQNIPDVIAYYISVRQSVARHATVDELERFWPLLVNLGDCLFDMSMDIEYHRRCE
ncbi:MAG: hypothetical protein JSS82_14075 [Bacteroidetes bacterium]|nr:hypothetical protein [Bacteroidota bacterium]